MPLPYAVATFNRRVTDRFVQPLIRRLAGFVVVRHTGDELFVVLTYGTRADWFKNAQANGGSLVTSTGTRSILRVERVGRDVASPILPWFVRIALRILTVHDVARIRTEAGQARTGGSRPPN